MNNDETRFNDLRFYGGIIVGAIFIFVLTGALSRLSSAVGAHALVLIISVVIVAVPRSLGARRAFTAFAWGIASGLIAATCFGAWMATVISQDASEKAAGQPYCLYVSDGRTGYRTAHNLLDLSPIRMWAGNDGPVSFQFHAVLSVAAGSQQAVYNWSYRQRQFEPFDGVRNNAVKLLPPCMPKPDYAGNLPLLRL